MEFSVLISVYYNDNPTFFKEALESLYNQELLPNEIVLVKDGPLSNELNHVIEKFVFNDKIDLKLVILEQNSGLGIALSTGLLKCSYDYVARMDSDDICKPNRFKKQVDFMLKNPKVDIVGSWIDEFVEASKRVISVRKVPIAHTAMMSYLKGRCPLNHSTVFFKKKSVFEAGNYQECYLKEDLFLWLRLYSNGFIFANIDESLLYFRITEDFFKRRGGLDYAKSELKMFNYRYKIGLINIFEYLYFVIITIPIRLMPTGLRALVYKKLLR